MASSARTSSLRCADGLALIVQKRPHQILHVDLAAEMCKAPMLAPGVAFPTTTGSATYGLGSSYMHMMQIQKGQQQLPEGASRQYVFNDGRTANAQMPNNYDHRAERNNAIANNTTITAAHTRSLT